MLKKNLYDTVLEFLHGVTADTWGMLQGNPPFKILFLRINGTGKTTTIAKMARFLIERNRRVVMAASDTAINISSVPPAYSAISYIPIGPESANIFRYIWR